jgi:MYXO-CTERM domain-containing protein
MTRNPHDGGHMKSTDVSRAFRSVRRSLAAALVAAAGTLGVFGCSDSSAPPPASSSEPTGNATEGELVMYVATLDDGTSEHRYGLRQGSAPELTLEFSAPPDFASGTRLRVWGATSGTTMHVDRFEQLPSVETVQAVEPLAGSESYAFVLVDLGGGVNITAQQAETAMFGTGATDKSFAEYYNESSYGKYTATGAVVGPFTFTLTTCANADTTALAQAIEPQIPQTYNHYVYYFGTRQTVCNFGGLGEEGSVGRPAKRTWVNGADSCVVLMQEPGHNIGLMHGNTIACPGATLTNTPVTDCTVTEYGSTFTTMGHGCRDFSGYERWYEQWLTGCGGVKVTSTGTFNLLPLEANCPAGVQVLQVPMPATRTIHDPQATTTNVNLNNYYVELRTPTGPFDTGLTPTLLVYASDNVRTGNQTSVWTELLDMNPATTAVDTLTAGQTFTDPSGSPAITLNSISASLANVTVTVTGGTGAPTCIGGATLSGSGPTTCMGAGDGGVQPLPDSGVGTILDASSPADARAPADAGRDSGRDATAPDAATSSSSSSSQTSTSSSSSSSSSRSSSTSSSSSSTSTASSSASSSTDDGRLHDSGGCSCEAAGARSGGSGAWLPLGLVGLLAWRLRRRGAARPA